MGRPRRAGVARGRGCPQRRPWAAERAHCSPNGWSGPWPANWAGGREAWGAEVWLGDACACDLVGSPLQRAVTAAVVVSTREVARGTHPSAPREAAGGARRARAPAEAASGPCCTAVAAQTAARCRGAPCLGAPAASATSAAPPRAFQAARRWRALLPPADAQARLGPPASRRWDVSTQTLALFFAVLTPPLTAPGRRPRRQRRPRRRRCAHRPHACFHSVASSRLTSKHPKRKIRIYRPSWSRAGLTKAMTAAQAALQETLQTCRSMAFPPLSANRYSRAPAPEPGLRAPPSAAQPARCAAQR